MSPEWRRRQRRSRGQPNYRLVRYADDFVVLVKGTRSDAEELRAEIGELLASKLKMTLSEEKTLVTHIDSGFDFLGFHIQRKTRGDGRRVVLTWPAKTNLAAVKTKIKQATGRATTSLRVGGRAEEGEPDPAGLGQLLPLRRVQTDVHLPGVLRLVADDLLATPQAPAALETAPSPLLRQRTDPSSRRGPLRPGVHDGRTLPLPRRARSSRPTTSTRSTRPEPVSGGPVTTTRASSTQVSEQLVPA